jgi:hypothetical protein
MIGMHISRKKLQVLLHVVVWSALFIIPTYLVFRETARDRYFMMNIWLQLAFYGIIFYLSYFWLAPRYFFGEKKAAFFIFTALMILLFTLLLGVYLYRFDPFYMGKHDIRRIPLSMVQPQSGMQIRILPPGEGPPKPFKYWPFINFFLTSGLVTGLSLGLRLSEKLMLNEKIRKESEKEKLNTELALLKHQINPHFLFNTLNSIYSLALTRSDQTAEAVMKLSDMMRYVIQDVGHESVPLSLELEYLGHYVELQQIRLSDNNTVQLQVKGDPGSLSIPPMILVPLIENAFKYGTSSHEPAVIDILLEIGHNMLKFRVINRIFGGRETPSTFGVGIQNTRQRLGLMYPGRHRLSLVNDGLQFTAELEIRLA